MKKRKKIIELCQKIVEKKFLGEKLEDKNIFFNDETVGHNVNKNNESIRISSKIKKKKKKTIKR